MAQHDISALNAVSEIVEVKVPHTNAEWKELGGTGGHTVSGGERSASEITRMGGATIQLFGRRGGYTMSIPIAVFHPHSDLTSLIQDALEGDRPKTKIGVRIRTIEDMIFTQATGTVAIASTGVVTFAGDGLADVNALITNGDIAAGDVIKVANARYRIASTDDSGILSVAPAPTTPLAATANYSVVTPEVVLTLPICTVTGFANSEVGTDGTYTSTLTVGWRGRLPKATVA